MIHIRWIILHKTELTNLAFNASPYFDAHQYAMFVLQIEMSQDINLIIPVLVAVFVAKMFADLLSKPLYKCQLEGKSMPYLDQEPEVVVSGQM